MPVISRRHLLQALAAGLLASQTAHATLLRAVSLPALAKRSDHVLLGTALDAASHFETIGGSRRIVTDVRLRVDAVLAKAAPAESVLVLRVLGGVVGRSGEYVAGQPELALAAPCAVFLRQLAAGEPYWVSGMAQGHFPIVADTMGTSRLAPSPKLPDILGIEMSAVKKLVGLTVPAAEEAIRKALES